MAFRSLITGIGGFAGSHLADALLESGDIVEGTCSPRGSLENIRHLSDRIKVRRCDIRSASETAEVIRTCRPDIVYHLAAVTHVPQGESDPRGVLETNFLGTLNLLEAMHREASGGLFLFISSSEVYGRVLPGDIPVREDHPKAPAHVYGLSKLVAELAAEMYHQTRGLSVVRLRPFNHIGPRQSDRFVCSSFARQVARIDERIQEPVIQVGNLTPVRDFTDVRDMARAYRLAAERCTPGGSPYQIASGKGVSIASVLKEFLVFTDTPIEVREDPSRLRKSDTPVLIGDCTRFSQASGWRPSIPLRESLRDIFQFWKRQLAGQGVP